MTEVEKVADILAGNNTCRTCSDVLQDTLQGEWLCVGCYVYNEFCRRRLELLEDRNKKVQELAEIVAKGVVDSTTADKELQRIESVMNNNVEREFKKMRVSMSRKDYYKRIGQVSRRWGSG